MQADLRQFSYKEVPALPQGYSLVLNIEEYIVTLLAFDKIRAQCRCSPAAFRILFILARAPYGANYAELLACLCCSEGVFHKVWATSSHEEALALLAPLVERWQRRLEKAALQGQSVLERELKMVRRATKERSGLNTILKKPGFSLSVQALYRKGYQLAPALPLRECSGS
jgi:hypothetical protein